MKDKSDRTWTRGTDKGTQARDRTGKWGQVRDRPGTFDSDTGRKGQMGDTKGQTRDKSGKQRRVCQTWDKKDRWRMGGKDDGQKRKRQGPWQEETPL